MFLLLILNMWLPAGKSSFDLKVKSLLYVFLVENLNYEKTNKYLAVVIKQFSTDFI